MTSFGKKLLKDGVRFTWTTSSSPPKLFHNSSNIQYVCSRSYSITTYSLNRKSANSRQRKSNISVSFWNQEKSLWTRRSCQELPTGRRPRPSGKSDPLLDSATFTGDSSRNSPISLDRLPPLPKRTLSLNGYPNTKPPSRP